MKGLLYKDFNIYKRSFVISIIIMTIFSAFGIVLLLGMTKGNFRFDFVTDSFINSTTGFIFSCLAFIAIFCELNAFGIMGMDERADWYRYLYSTPIDAITEVSSRYIFIFTITSVMTVFIAILQPIIYTFGKITYDTGSLKTILYIFVFSLILHSIRLPIEIIFNSKTSNIINMMIYFVLLIASMIFLTIAEELNVAIKLISDFISKIKHLLPFILIIFIILSYLISCFFKKRKRYI